VELDFSWVDFLHLEDRVITVYEEEREVIITYVSTYDLQRQSIKANQRQTKQSCRRDFILNTRIHIIKKY